MYAIDFSKPAAVKPGETRAGGAATNAEKIAILRPIVGHLQAAVDLAAGLTRLVDNTLLVELPALLDVANEALAFCEWMVSDTTSGDVLDEDMKAGRSRRFAVRGAATNAEKIAILRPIVGHLQAAVDLAAGLDNLIDRTLLDELPALLDVANEALALCEWMVSDTTSGDVLDEDMKAGRSRRLAVREDAAGDLDALQTAIDAMKIVVGSADDKIAERASDILDQIEILFGDVADSSGDMTMTGHSARRAITTRAEPTLAEISDAWQRFIANLDALRAEADAAFAAADPAALAAAAAEADAALVALGEKFAAIPPVAEPAADPAADA